MESLGRCPDSKPTPTLRGWVHVPLGNRRAESVSEYKPAPTAWAWPCPPLTQARGAVAAIRHRMTPQLTARAGTWRCLDTQRPHPPPAFLHRVGSAALSHHPVEVPRGLRGLCWDRAEAGGWAQGADTPRALGSLLGAGRTEPGLWRHCPCRGLLLQEWTAHMEQPLEVSGSLWQRWPRYPAKGLDSGPHGAGRPQ